MASIAAPTWAEVQAMDSVERAAFNIIRGEMSGDTFLWDSEWYDKDGSPQRGGWKSQIDGNKGGG